MAASPGELSTETRLQNSRVVEVSGQIAEDGHERNCAFFSQRKGDGSQPEQRVVTQARVAPSQCSKAVAESHFAAFFAPLFAEGHPGLQCASTNAKQRPKPAPAGGQEGEVASSFARA